MEGTQAPSQIEYLYERYRHLLWWVVGLVVAGFAANYLYRAQVQSGVDRSWSAFAVSIGLDESYADIAGARKALVDHLGGKDLAGLEQAFESAEPVQKPYLLLAISRRAMLDRNWERAGSALDQLASSYPEHSLVVETDYPIQVRDVIQDEDGADDRSAQKKPEYKPAQSGSIVGRMRDQIAKAKDYERPAQFAKIPVPEDAPKVKIDFSDGYSITIALMTEQAPLHCAKFLELAEAGFWKDINVDEIQREAQGLGAWKNPMQFHLGFTTTKEVDRTKWTKTDPSENQVEYEDSGLSHFEGAVAARLEADGMSCADRFYVCAEDYSMMDGSRVVFGYVVEGLDNAKLICDAPMSEQENQAGRGVPETNITVTGVTVIK